MQVWKYGIERSSYFTHDAVSPRCSFPSVSSVKYGTSRRLKRVENHSTTTKRTNLFRKKLVRFHCISWCIWTPSIKTSSQSRYLNRPNPNITVATPSYPAPSSSIPVDVGEDSLGKSPHGLRPVTPETGS